MTAILPALILGVISVWSGTFYGGASAWAAMTTWLLVLGFASLGVGDWRDPLRLGRAGRLLPWAYLVLVGVAWLASPVGRAGLVGLVTAPAWLLLPSAVAHCWRTRSGARLGSAAVGLIVSAVALVALLHWLLADPPRPAMPLGHHNLLAGWLVMTVPLALARLDEPGVPRWWAGLAGGTGVAVILTTGSLTALAALTLQTVMALWLWRKARPGGPVQRWFPAAFLTAVVLLAWRVVPRLLDLAVGHDGSLSARRVYFEAGWRGLIERPILGWGPGAVPWTISGFLQPIAGTNPASEIVGDLHSMPIQVAYETGVTGLALVLGLIAVFLLRRRLEVRRSGDPVSARLALISLAGALVVLLGSAPLQIPALATAFAVSAGACLASSRSGPEDTGTSARRAFGPAAAYTVYLFGALVLLLPVARAHFNYDRAVRSTDDASRISAIMRAGELDPSFPLYAFRQVLLEPRTNSSSAGATDLARRTAAAAPGLAPLWLTAGYLELERGEPTAFEALLEAHRLDPLAPLPAFHLMRSRPGHPMAATWGARALAADPRLGAAQWWRGRTALWQESLDLLARGAPATAATLERATIGAATADRAGNVLLALGFDGDRTVSFSLFAFRRRPWPASLAPVRLEVGFLEALEAARATIGG